MEIIQLAGYTEYDKLNIARNFLIKKQSAANGISSDNIDFGDEILLYIIRHYTKEAGVRNMEREIGSVCRKVAKEVVRNGPETRVEISESIIQEFLGIPKFHYGRAEEEDEIGLAMGLAWTEFGGDILGIETVIMPGKGKVMITGKLGEVMQESAQAALSYVRSRANSSGSILISTGTSIYTSMSLKGPFPRTARQRASRWRPRLFPRSAKFRSEAMSP